MVLDSSQIQVFQIISGVLVFLSILLVIFSTFGITRFFERREAGKIPFYYAFSNLSFLISATCINMGLLDAIEVGTKTHIYYWGLIGMNIGIILASMFLYQFFSELNDIPKEKRIICVIFAFLIICFQLLPQNNWFVEFSQGFQLKYISYLLQTIYCVSIYLSSAIGLKLLASHVEEQRTSFICIMTGNILLCIFFLLMMMRAFIKDGPMLLVIQLSSWILQIIALILLFWGFIRPSIKKGDVK